MKSLKLFLAGAIAMAGIVSISSCKGDEQATIAVTDVSLNETSLSLKVGETFELKAFVSPSNATDPSIKWESDNEAVATVKGGTVTAEGEGDAVITASSTDGSGIEALCYVTVASEEPGDSIPLVSIVEHSSGGLSGGSGWVVMTADITSDGGTPIIERGMETEEIYAGSSYTTRYPAEDGGAGQFTMNISYALQGNKLSIRAYATNQAGYTGYSDWVTVYEE